MDERDLPTCDFKMILDGYSALQQLPAYSKVPQINLNQTSTAHFYIDRCLIEVDLRALGICEAAIQLSIPCV